MLDTDPYLQMKFKSIHSLWDNLPFQSPVQRGYSGTPCDMHTTGKRGKKINEGLKAVFFISAVGLQDMWGVELTSLYMLCSLSSSSGFMAVDTFSTVRRQISLFSPSVTILHKKQ